jgi:hypothetical protein
MNDPRIGAVNYHFPADFDEIITVALEAFLLYQALKGESRRHHALVTTKVETKTSGHSSDTCGK